MTYLFIFISLCILSWALTYIMKQIAHKRALMDIPNERSSHSDPTPHGGGVAIALTWFAGISYLFFADKINTDLFYSLMVGVVIALLSFLDDIHDLSLIARLRVQLFAALAGLWFLGGLKMLDFGLFTIENPIVTNTIAVFAIIWFINLYNFLDGIDGYAGSEAVFLGVAGYLLFNNELFLVLIASVLGFLVWNWHKAKIFMGDVGSTLLGYNVAVFTIYYANQEASNLWVWIVLFGLFWFDATLTLIRRYRNGERLSFGHKKHAYQRLHQSSWPHDKVVLFSILVNLVLFSLVYLISNKLIAFFIALAVLYGVMKFVDKKMAFDTSSV